MTDEEMAIEFGKAMDSWEEYRRARAIKALFEKSSRSCEWEDYPFITRWFCWLKTYLCLKLKRMNASYIDNNMFNILTYDESFGYEGSSWEGVWVSTKLLKGWNVCVASDGT